MPNKTLQPTETALCDLSWIECCRKFINYAEGAIASVHCTTRFYRWNLFGRAHRYQTINSEMKRTTQCRIGITMSSTFYWPFYW